MFTLELNLTAPRLNNLHSAVAQRRDAQQGVSFQVVDRTRLLRARSAAISTRIIVPIVSGCAFNRALQRIAFRACDLNTFNGFPQNWCAGCFQFLAKLVICL